MTRKVTGQELIPIPSQARIDWVFTFFCKPDRAVAFKKKTGVVRLPPFHFLM